MCIFFQFGVGWFNHQAEMSRVEPWWPTTTNQVPFPWWSEPTWFKCWCFWALPRPTTSTLDGPRLHRLHQLRLVVEIPLFRGFLYVFIHSRWLGMGFLPPTVAPENKPGPKRKLSRIPTIHFQALLLLVFLGGYWLLEVLKCIPKSFDSLGNQEFWLTLCDLFALALVYIYRWLQSTGVVAVDPISSCFDTFAAANFPPTVAISKKSGERRDEGKHPSPYSPLQMGESEHSWQPQHDFVFSKKKPGRQWLSTFKKSQWL